MKNALITGASRGIGRAIAHKLAASGYTLFLNSRHPDDLTELARELTESCGAICYPVAADAADYSQIQNAFTNHIYSRVDHLDVVVNNAGISHIGLLQDMSEQEWDQVINTNLKSVFNCTKMALTSMIRQHAGHIVNISSVWGISGASMEVAYSASKGGVNAFTQALARETAPSGIRVNAIACGVIDTSMNGHLSADERSDLMNQIGLGRFGRPEEVADLVLYLISENASYLTGQILTLDGSFI